MGFVRPPDELGHVTPAPRAEVRAAEEMFFIPDQSQEAACRALIAADIDGVPRSSVIVVTDGMLVPHCVYTAYNQLLQYPPPCCSCATELLLSLVTPQPLYYDDYEDLYCYGAGIPEGAQVYVNDVPVSTYEAWWVSPNLVVGFFDTFDDYVAGETLTVTVRYGDLISNPYSMVMQPRPPAPTLTSVSPTSAALGVPLTVTVHGTNFRPIDLINWHPPAGTGYGYWQLETTFVSDTEMRGQVQSPHFVNGPGDYYVQIGARPEQSPYAQRQFVSVSPAGAVLASGGRGGTADRTPAARRPRPSR